jgi:hypothetical protein
VGSQRKKKSNQKLSCLSFPIFSIFAQQRLIQCESNLGTLCFLFVALFETTLTMIMWIGDWFYFLDIRFQNSPYNITFKFSVKYIPIRGYARNWGPKNCNFIAYILIERFSFYPRELMQFCLLSPNSQSQIWRITGLEFKISKFWVSGESNFQLSIT